MNKALLLILPLLLTFFAFPIRCEANTVETWAVIVGGFEEYPYGYQFLTDTYYLYHVLKCQGVRDDHITYLYAGGPSSAYEPGSIDEVSTKENVRYAIGEWLPSHADANDEVIVYFSAHGGGYNTEKDKFDLVESDGANSDECIEHKDSFGVDECLFVHGTYDNPQLYYDDELRQDLFGLTCGSLTIILGACYSGGFIDDLSGMGTIVACANEIQTSNMDMDGDGFSEFDEVFFDALLGYDTYMDWATNRIVNDTEVNADYNGDGKVSWREAFDYAYENDDARIAGKETPWFDDDGNGYPTYVDGRVYVDYRLTLTHNWGGTTDPSGEHIYVEGTVVSVYAIVTVSGYEFDHWVPDHWPWPYSMYNIYPRENPHNVIMDTDHSLYAYFVKGSTGGGDTCPTLFVWNGSDYVDYGVIDIHNPSGEDVVREVAIAEQDLAVENRRVKIRLREGWEGLNFSESVIDQVKLYAIDEDGKLKLCPLTSAAHSRLGDVHEYLALSDDVKTQIFLLETIDLTFKVREDSQGFVFVIEGCNMLKM